MVGGQGKDVGAGNELGRYLELPANSRAGQCLPAMTSTSRKGVTRKGNEPPLTDGSSAEAGATGVGHTGDIIEARFVHCGPR
jgi:hypothetical protein